MRKVIRASVLIMALAMPAFAGEIPYGVTSPPPPSGARQEGDIPNGVAGETPNNVTGEIPYGVTSSDPTTAEALINLLIALIS